MSDAAVWRYRLLRNLGRAVTRACAVLTLGRMPPFVSTSVIVTDGSRVLVVVDPIRKEPILPGGHLAWAETPQEAAAREVLEETGMRVEIGELLDVLGGAESTGEGGVVRVIYRGFATGGTLTSSGEGEARWLEIADMLASAGRDAPIVRRWFRLSEHEG